MNRYENRMKFFEEVEGIKPQIYYHYTSLEVLYNIVSSKTLWLTSLKSSNDKKELFYTVDDFLRDFEIVCETEKTESIKKCFYALMRNIDENIVLFKKVCDIKSKPYALCLSDKKDNLTHWDRYAASSAGVCIGINVAALNVLYSRTGNDVFGSSLFDIGKALYTEEDIHHYIRRETIGRMKSLFDIMRGKSNEEIIKRITTYGYTLILGVCQNVMRFAKNTSFIDEGEVRMYFDKQSISDTKTLIKFLYPKMTLKLVFIYNYKKLPTRKKYFN